MCLGVARASGPSQSRAESHQEAAQLPLRLQLSLQLEEHAIALLLELRQVVVYPEIGSELDIATGRNQTPITQPATHLPVFGDRVVHENLCLDAIAISRSGDHVRCRAKVGGTLPQQMAVVIDQGRIRNSRD